MSRVLFLAPALPWPPDAGGRLRTGHLLRALHPEHELHLWCPQAPDSTEQDRQAVAELCSELRTFERTRRPALLALSGPNEEGWFWSRPMAQALQGLRAGEFDLLHVDELCLTRQLPGTLPMPRVMHHHKLDLELALALRPAGPRRDLESQRWRLLEREALAQATTHVFCCDEDAQRFRGRHPIVETHVVENGVNTSEFEPGATVRDRNHLLFLGSMDYAPNVRGLDHFLREAWPQLKRQGMDLRLSIVGRGARAGVFEELPDGVTWVGAVQDVRPWLARASALVVPLDVGGGTRLKIVEAAAAGCPIVSTNTGAEGLRFRDGEQLLLAPSIGELPRVLHETLRDPALAAARSERARQMTLQHYDWNSLARTLSAVWRTRMAQADESC